LGTLDPERMLVETDAPYLSPQEVRSKRNEPKHVVHTARFVAGRIGMDEEEFGTLTSRNARNVFGLPLEV
jgi:TatD DNase family protein